jgi:SAM-dependent methyltransferase
MQRSTAHRSPGTGNPTSLGAAYDRKFFDAQRSSSHLSATVVVPIAMELIAPRSVVDVGCGVGTWLAVFKERGCDVCGVDGDYVDRSSLMIPPPNFTPSDLGRPLALGRTFDLAVSLEVAEHLAPERGPSFVRDLTLLAPAVMFSAAIPGQGGVNHVNERWQDYWAGLFLEHGYEPADVIRPRVWMDDRVDAFYRQNTILFVKASERHHYQVLARYLEHPPQFPLAVVHPRAFAGLVGWFAPENMGVRRVTRELMGSVWRAARKRLAPVRAGRRGGKS